MTSQHDTYLARDLSTYAARALSAVPVVVITGLRQAGKTTFLRRDPIFRGRRYLNLDTFATLEAARQDPDGLILGEDPLLIDEAQRAPELLLALKRAVDHHRRPGQFVLSGSANLSLLEGASETLAGRSLYMRLHPFTRRELKNTDARPFLPSFFEQPRTPEPGPIPDPVRDEEILDGGMPPVAVDRSDRRLWLRGYEQTYIERDVRQLRQVADLGTFRNLVRLSALRSAQLLNTSSLGRDAKLPATTTARYLDVLETSFVIERLPAFVRSKSQRLMKSPKLFVADSGLAAHLAAVDEISLESGEALRGPLWETWVFQNLRGLVDAFLPDVELGFWSIQGRHEVDFVLSRGRRSIAIEVKSGTRFRKSDLTGLRHFLEVTPGAVAGVLAYNGREAVSLGDRAWAIPLDTLLS
ncbi:MAG: ATP-binding protein [Holophagales bacterium]|nr:ATP-binding protein [Holophagales bacterium]